jgi:hypothetical protein
MMPSSRKQDKRRVAARRFFESSDRDVERTSIKGTCIPHPCVCYSMNPYSMGD